MSARWLYAWGLGSVSFGGASLLVPLYLVQLGASPVDLGVLAATAAVIGAPGAILFGRLANQVTRRRPLVLATLAVVSGTLAAVPLLTSVTAVIVVNAVLWLVVASVAPVLTMLVVDDAPESVWAERIGLLNKYQGYGWAGGLVLGMVWPLVGPLIDGPAVATRTLFWVLAACALVSAAAAATALPRPDRHVTSERQLQKVGRLLANSRRGIRGATFVFAPNRLYWTTRRFRPRRVLKRLNSALALYFIAAALFFVGFAAFWAPLPLLLTGSSFSTGQIFALYLVSSLSSAVLYEAAGRLTSRFDVRTLQAGALAVRGLLFPAIAVAAGLGVVALKLGGAAAGLIAIGATWAVIAVVGTSIVTRLAPPSIRGDVLGAYISLGAVAGGVGGILGGWAARFGFLIAFGVAGGFVVLGALIVVLIRVLSSETGPVKLSTPGAVGPADIPNEPETDQRQADS